LHSLFYELLNTSFSMKTIEISGEKRNGVGTSNAKLARKEGKIPCVIYGGSENIHFMTDTLSVRDIIYTDEFRLANITVDGKAHKCIVKDVQFHTVNDSILHIDFQSLEAVTQVKVQMPIKLQGTSEGQKVGGTLVQKMRRLLVLSSPSSLLSFVPVDISALELGKSMRVRDVQLPEGMVSLTNGSIPIVTIDIPRALRSAQTKAAEGKKK
jgi:large subunit ribosomal protein L25